MAKHDYKVFDRSGEYVGSCAHSNAAAALLVVYGEGAKVKFGHGKTVWHEGREGFRCLHPDQFARVGRIITDRCNAIIRDSYIKANGQEAYDAVMAGRKA